MKLEDVKIGMKVIDKFGNEYEIVEVTEDEQMPVKVKCTKFLKPIHVQDFGNVYIDKVGKSYYIFKSKKVARKRGCDGDYITVKSLKLKDELK